MAELHLCANCLEAGATPFPVGPDQGTQRDPYRATVDLCPACRPALQHGDFARLHARFTATRTVRLND